MIPFSESAQQLLSQHGWFPARHVDLSAIIEELSREGFHIFDAAKLILESVQDIRVRNNDVQVIEFKALIGLGTFEDVQPWMQANSLCLYPVGGWSQYTMYIAENNGLYVTDFEKVAKIGEEISDGLDALLFGYSSQVMKIVPPSLI
jgi:hypothetical protein